MRSCASDEKGKSLEEHSLSSNPYNIPNFLSASRIVASPWLFHLISSGNAAPALGCFTVFAITDWVDGYIAKNYNQRTVLGSYLDPLADKVMVATCAAALWVKGDLPYEVFALIALKDSTMFGIGVYIRKLSLGSSGKSVLDVQGQQSLQVTPLMIGKINTAASLLLFGAFLVEPVLGIPGSTTLGLGTWFVGATTILTAGAYVKHLPKAWSSVAGANVAAHPDYYGPLPKRVHRMLQLWGVAATCGVLAPGAIDLVGRFVY